MKRPTYLNLENTTHRQRQPSVSICSGSSGPQGNPRFYKYYWRVFSIESPWEGEDFFIHAPVLSNTEYVDEVNRLLRNGHSCMVYGFKRPRKDLGNPWDLSHPKWANAQFAVSWDEDMDPPGEGGHK